MRFVLLALLLATPALAHDHWINQPHIKDPLTGAHCCSAHKDCNPVKIGGVREVAGGFFVATTGEVIPHGRVLWESRDGSWWQCLMHKDGKPVVRCLIGVPPGS